MPAQKNGKNRGAHPLDVASRGPCMDGGDGKRVATGNATGLYFSRGEQVGSTNLMTSITGTLVTQMLFKLFGHLQDYWGSLQRRHHRAEPTAL